MTIARDDNYDEDGDEDEDDFISGPGEGRRWKMAQGAHADATRDHRSMHNNCKCSFDTGHIPTHGTVYRLD